MRRLATSCAVVGAFVTLCVAGSQAAVDAPERPGAATTAPGKPHPAPQAPSSQDGHDPLRTAFHVAYRSDKGAQADKDGIMLDVIVSPSDRHVSGIFEMTRPVDVRSHVTGSYTQEAASSTIVAELTGWPQFQLPCRRPRGYGEHGRPVWQNAKISLRIDPSWRGGTADISYAEDPDPYTRHLQWKDLSGIELDGGVPTHWKEVTDILWRGQSPTVWNEKWTYECSDPETSAQRRLLLLVPDASWRRLEIKSEHKRDGGASWSVRNNSDRHILASVACVSRAPSLRDTDARAMLIHPFETVALFDFPDAEQRSCGVRKSHYD